MRGALKLFCMKKPEKEEEPAICLSKIQLSGRGVGGEVDTHAGSFSVLTSQPSLERRKKKKNLPNRSLTCYVTPGR